MPSEVTLRKLIAKHPDFPIIRRGNHGRKYRIDLEAAETFVRKLREQRALDPLERSKAIAALRLDMLAQAEERVRANG